jgi:hypothetical protein
MVASGNDAVLTQIDLQNEADILLKELTIAQTSERALSLSNCSQRSRQQSRSIHWFDRIDVITN